MQIHLIVLACVLFVAFFLWIVAPQAKKSTAVKSHAASLMAGREPMTPQQFADAFFQPAQRETATGVNRLLKEVLVVDVARIRPDDRLVGDLGLAQIDGMDVNLLASDIADHFGVSVLPKFINHDPTVRELVELCCLSVES